MSEAERAPSDEQSESERLDIAVDQAIAACGSVLCSTIRSLILVTEYLEYELQTKVSLGYIRGVSHGRWNTYSG